MDVLNPRRILILSPPNSNVPDFLKGTYGPPLSSPHLNPIPSQRNSHTAPPATDLTGSTPSPNPDLSSSSLAGLSHNLPLKTAYYTANIPIWIDEIGSAEEWRDEFLRPEAKEVLAVLGAVVLCFRKPVDDSEMVGLSLRFSFPCFGDISTSAFSGDIGGEMRAVAGLWGLRGRMC